MADRLHRLIKELREAKPEPLMGAPEETEILHQIEWWKKKYPEYRKRLVTSPGTLGPETVKVLDAVFTALKQADAWYE